MKGNAAKGAYGFSECSATECPRDRDLTLRPLIAKSQMLQDTSGHYWCQMCQRRCELMDWAKEQGWPGVRVQGRMIYAIYGDGEVDWFTTLVACNQDMIDALYEALIEKTRELLPPWEG